MKYLLWYRFWRSFCTWHASWYVVYAEMQSLGFIKRKRNFSRSVLSAHSLFVKWSTGPTVYHISSWRTQNIHGQFRMISSNYITQNKRGKHDPCSFVYTKLTFCLLAILVHVVVWKWVPQLRFSFNTQFEAQVRKKYLWSLLMVSSIHNTA